MTKNTFVLMGLLALVSSSFASAGPCDYGKITQSEDGNYTRFEHRFTEYKAALEKAGFHFDESSKNVALISVDAHQRILSFLNPLFWGVDLFINLSPDAPKDMGLLVVGNFRFVKKAEVFSPEGEKLGSVKKVYSQFSNGMEFIRGNESDHVFRVTQQCGQN